MSAALTTSAQRTTAPPVPVMNRSEFAAIVLAAGKGTRMKSARPKVLHPIAGRPMVNHVLDTLAALGAARTVVVVGPGMDDVAAAVAPAKTALQPAQRGTADAVKAARKHVAGFGGTVLILYADTPLLSAETLAAMLAAREGPKAPAVVVLGFRPADPGPYGRLVVGAGGRLKRIVEARDASAAERRIRLCNSGVMAVDGHHLFALVDAVKNDNAKREFYLTDIVGLAARKKLAARYIEAPEAELMGVNDRADLARAEAAWQDARRARAMREGATLLSPATVTFAHDTRLGQDVTIGPNVVFGPGVSVADGAAIRAFCHIEGAAIGAGATVGPFARLRPGTILGEGVHIGNFVEAKAARFGAGAKANHLSYLGDAEIGAAANIGAGTITCNYDGVLKHKTTIGAGAFVGSNTALVAPVTVGDGAMIGAGSTIARDVAPGALAVTRAEHKEIPEAARRFRERRQREKAARAAKKES
jgi:bifunctional UDP-N-acetylglucosamine pyrophosphorylase / glucosamine-1-phosphate N-acetyltransferase